MINIPITKILFLDIETVGGCPDYDSCQKFSPEIASQFEAMKNKSEGAAEVMITSAFPIEGSALNDLLSSLKKRFGGRDLRPTIQIDPALIGGVRIQVGDEVMDSSVKARLAQMQVSLGA